MVERVAEPVGRAVGERGPRADDDCPQASVGESDSADGLAGAWAAIDAHEARGDEPEHDSGGSSGDLEGQTVSAGGDCHEVEGDDSRRYGERAGEAGLGDLGMG